MWFTWCDALDVVTGWRKVGIAGNVLDPSLISRENFIDRVLEPAAEEAPAGVVAAAAWAAAVRTPEHLRTASRRAKDEAKLSLGQALFVQQAETHSVSMRKRAFDPAHYGLLEVPAPEVQRPDLENARLDCHNGSMSIRGLRDINHERLATAQQAEAAKQAKAGNRAQRRADEEREEQEQEKAFELCGEVCMCGALSCPMARASRCETCRRISMTGRVCVKRNCIAARRDGGAALEGGVEE